MMKKILLTLLAFMLTIAMNAEQVSKQQALQKAQQFMPGKRFGEARSFARSAGSSEGEPFYVFNAKGNGGYVIVSGDDRTTEILGYSTTGTLDMEKIPDNLKWWLDSYARQIEAFGTSAKPAQKANTRGAGGWAAVSPMIKTKWDQFEPYNLMCPDVSYVDYDESGYNANFRCATGCVATAMAQVIYYWQCQDHCNAIGQIEIGQWINKGTNVNPDYQFVVDHTFHGLPATTFKWERMALSYSPDATGKSANEVAKLMRYCGQAVNMDYSIGGSSASLSPAVMAEYFGFGLNAHLVNRSMYSSSDWEDMVYKEVSEARPVLYSGSSMSSGHQFVVDGYDGKGLFHINWGWGGKSDGFFVLSLANPDELGAGGGTSPDGFTKDQTAIIGLKPATDGEVEIPQFYGDFYDVLAQSEFSRTSTSKDFMGVSLPGWVFFQYEDYTKPGECSFETAWGLYQNGNLLDVVGTSGLITRQNGYVAKNISVFAFGKDLPDGQYQFRQMYRLQGSTEWQLCKAQYDVYGSPMILFIEAVVSGNNLTLRQSETDEYTSKITVNSVSFSPKSLEAGKPVEVTVNLTNNGDSYQELVYLTLGDVKTVVCGSVEAGQTGSVKLHLTPAQAGTMPLKVSTDYYAMNEVWSESVTVEAAKPHSLSATVTTPGLVNNVLTGTTLRVNASITNNGSSEYENGILLRLFENTAPPGSFIISGSMVKEKSVSVQIKPGKTKDVDFTIADLDPAVNYFAYLYYYSAGKLTKFYDVKPFTPTEVPGDLTGDFIVDKNDIAAIIQLIMVGQYDEKADLNNDNKVDAADLVLLIDMLK